jgi:hypothetical protein
MREAIASIIGVIVVATLWIGGTIFHIWTTMIAFEQGGSTAGFLTFIMPGLSALYWLFSTFDISSGYTILGLVSIAMLVISSIFTD